MNSFLFLLMNHKFFRSASGNYLTEIPDIFDNFPSLKHLFDSDHSFSVLMFYIRGLSSNRLSFLVKSIVNLTNLVDLLGLYFFKKFLFLLHRDISNNKFIEIPEEALSLKSLTALYFF